MSKILTVLKKELRRFFTDSRMLSSIFLPGILIFVIYSLLGSVVTDFATQEITEYVVYIENEPTELEDIFNIEGWTIERRKEIQNKDEIFSKVSAGEIDLYVVYEEDFYNKSLNHKTGEGVAPKVEIYYNSTVDSSYSLYTHLVTMLDVFENRLSNRFDVNIGEGINYNLATEEDISAKIIGMILPFILVVFLISGAMGICSESIAGEKERGTMATLLVTPIKRRDLVIGKISALGITTIAGAFVSFLGLILSLPKLAGANFSFTQYNIGHLALLLFIVILTALFFTTILTIISTYAKSVKEATSLSTPLTMIVMVIGMTGMMSTTANANPFMYLIPIYNSIQMFTGILNQSIDILAVVFTIISNVICISSGVFLLTKMFDNEKIMFNK